MRWGELLRGRRRVLGEAEQGAATPRGQVQEVEIDAIDPSPYQPRDPVDEGSLEDLVSSLQAHGMLQPILVRRRGDRFELIAGERRWRAARLLGWERVPAQVVEAGEGVAAELALVENLQREDLSPLEEARGYQRLLEEFGLTQEELAQRLGRSQGSIANKLRLLRLPESVQVRLAEDSLTERHARALLRLRDGREQEALAAEVVRSGLSVRETEARVDRRLAERDGKGKARRQRVVRVYKDLRLLRNSVEQLVREARRGGLDVGLEEREDEESWEIRVRIRKPPR